LLGPILTRHKLPGMVAALVEGERTVGLGATGVRRRGSPEKVTVDDRFHIGSCTKSMTATLCATLVEQGRLSWDTSLSQAFPKLAEKMHRDYRSVTLEQLLTHRGGLPGDLSHGWLLGLLRLHTGTPTEARQFLLESVVTRPPAAMPGTKYIYSNAGYAIAGHTAETAVGRPWEALLEERLFHPLGMSTAGFGAPGKEGLLDEPRGHASSGKPVEPGPFADNPVAIAPAGTVHCSIEDWAKYIVLHLRGGQGKSEFLKPETFKKLHTPVGDDASPRYAMGWLAAERDWGGGTVLTHAGSNTMWFAVVWLAPKRDFAVLVACNQGGDQATKACDEAAGAVIREYLAMSR
jgi:CubicO group peptidase (beta-lactamase class C family)